MKRVERRTQWVYHEDADEWRARCAACHTDFRQGQPFGEVTVEHELTVIVCLSCHSQISFDPFFVWPPLDGSLEA